MKRFLSAIPALFLLATVSTAQADDVSDLKNEIRQLKEMLQHESEQRKALEAKVDGIEGRDERLQQAADEGSTVLFDLRDDNSPFSISGGVTGVIQGTSGNSKSVDGTSDRSALAFSFDLSLNTRLSEHQRFIVDLEAGHGDNINDVPGGVGAISTPNYDPYNTTNASQTNITLSGAYYEGIYCDERLVVTLGKIDGNGFFDDNAFANDETSQFMSAMFVRNTGTIFTEVDNYYAPGLAMQYSATDYLDIALIGISNTYSDLFNNNTSIIQANIKPQLIADREGNYRFYVVVDSRDTNTHITTGKVKNNVGYGISIDQEFTEEIGIFARAAWQDKNLTPNIVQSTYSGGINLSGSLWGREADNVGIAYGVIDLNNNISPNQKNENHFEIYYNAEVLSQVHVSPDVQYIQNVLGASGQYRNVMAYAVRGQFDF